MGQGGQAGQAAWAAVVLAVLTVVLTYPISIHPGSTSLGNDPDVHTYTWTLAWDVHALTTRPWDIFDANIFFPYAQTLAFSENLIGSAFLAAPFLWATGNPVLALNAVSLLSVFLCGLGVYVLGRRLGLGFAAALIAGIIFAFSPARFFRFAQTHLTTIQWMPFALAALIAYLDGAGRRHLWLAIGLFTLQVLTSGHGAVYLLIAAALLTVIRLLTGTPIAPLGRLRDIGLPGLALLAPTVWMMPPYFRVQQELGLRRSLENWAPAAISFLASPSTLHAWILSKVTTTSVNTAASAFMFPGYAPILLAVAALVPGPSSVKRRDVVFFVLLTVLAGLLSAGPPLGLWPLVYWLPGFNFIRIPSRFILLAMMGIAVLAGIGFDRLIGRITPGRARIAGVLVGAILVAEFSTVPLPVQPYHGRDPVARSLARYPAEAVRDRRGPGQAIGAIPQHLHAALDGALAADRARPQQPADAAARTALRRAPDVSRRPKRRASRGTRRDLRGRASRLVRGGRVGGRRSAPACVRRPAHTRARGTWRARVSHRAASPAMIELITSA